MSANGRTGLEIAVIGMACRFPGAPELDAYWRVLRDGVETITFFTAEELVAAGVDPDLVRRPDYVRARGMLDAAEEFDADFFDITPNEAAAMDPQHRLFLELAWTALEHAGHRPDDFDGLTGVYAGAHEAGGYAALLTPDSPMAGALGPFATKLGLEKDYLATRAAYKFGLGGPALSVQTACSTSLVATHLAVQGLLAGECDMALAGGVTVHAAQRSGYLYEPGGIFSPDGHCRSFDADARGAVSSSGGGVVVLRRLEDALASGDTVHAVILGSAINNDGSRRVGYTAPGVAGQSRVIRAAQLAAGVAPDTISYVEAHGSGTHLGDPVEVAALTRAFREGTDATGFCAIGSVKSNIGHTHAAAGVAGLIKTVLALRHRQLPASLHFHRPNPRIDFAASPFRVNARLTEWTGPYPLRAGVSSFGLGGSNAHVVVEEAPPVARDPEPPRWEVVTVSARQPRARQAREEELAAFLTAHPDADLSDVAGTLHMGRKAFEHRTAVVARGVAEAREALTGPGSGRLRGSHTSATPPPVAFLLPGVGDLTAGLGRELYDQQPVFREHLDACAELLRPRLDLDLRTLLFADRPRPAGPDLAALLGRGTARVEDDPLVRTLVAQPATFAFEYALAQMWLSWGVRPAALLGYSIGEFTAACLAGVFGLADALMLVTERARLIERAPAGAMLAVPLPASRLEEWLHGDVWLAAEEAPQLCVVAGTPDAVAGLADRLAGHGVASHRVRTAHAFHCPLLAGQVDHLNGLVSTVERKPPGIPFISNVSGDWITDEEAVDAEYWGRHLCRPVQLARGIERLGRTPGQVLLEVGPGQALTSAALQAPADAAARLVVSSMPTAFDDRPEAAAALTAAAKLWLSGVDIDWPATRGGPWPRRIPLPTYPFQRRRHWIDRDARGPRTPTVRRSDPSTWFTVPSWVSTPPAPEVRPTSRRTWLVVHDEAGLGEALARRLAELDQDVVEARPGRDLQRLADELAGAGRLPDTVVHLGTVYRPGERVDLADTARCLDDGFFGLLALARGLAAHAADRPLHLAVVTTGAFQVTGDDPVIPGNAAVLGPCRVLPKEHPRWTTSCVDLRRPGPDVVERLVHELSAPAAPVVAYRGRRRWLPELRPVPAPEGGATRLRPRGRYLVLGGFGGLGLTLAGHLADEVGARLVLVGRVALPPADRWDEWLDAHGEDDRVGRRIRAVRALEARGAEVLPVTADVTDLDQMRAALRLADDRFGGIDGVIHAAGVLAEGLTQLKDADAAAAAMAAKTTGTVVLDTLLRDRTLDFVVLCASTVGVLGAVGQVDYCAANAFLDAYAQRPGPQPARMVVAVDWDGWQRVGMVAAAAARAERLLDEEAPVERVDGHPLLELRQVGPRGRAVYATDLSPGRHWVLDEHRMHGHPVVAGTVYLAMVVDALRDLGHAWPLELRDVAFLTPAVHRDGSTRRLHLVLDREGDGFRFAFASRGPESGWIQHVSGRVGPAGEPPAGDVPVGDQPGSVVDLPPHAGPMTLGGRSQCLGPVRAGTHTATAEIVLPPAFRDDLERLALHPSLLDIATGYVNMHLSPVFRMPLAYARIRIDGPLPGSFVSRVTAREGIGDAGEVATYDVELVDADGRVVVAIEGLTMKRPAGLDARLAALAEGAVTDVATYRPGHRRARLVSAARDGLTPEEGVAAFARILGRDLSPQVIVAPRSIETVVAELDGAGPDATEPADAGPAAGQARPALMNEYVEPRTDLERDLVTLWQRLLGTAQIGVHDRFADLGGHSLFAVRLASLIRETHHVDLPLSHVLAAPTVAELAELITRTRAQQAAT